MKSFVVALAVLAMASFASALDKAADETYVENNSILTEEDGELFEGSPRVGFLSFNNGGATLTFNSTSLQYAVVIGIVLLLVALVAIPLLGFDLGGVFAPRDGYDQQYYQTYDQTPVYSTYTNYAKRSLDTMVPILTALSEAYKKYE